MYTIMDDIDITISPIK